MIVIKPNGGLCNYLRTIFSYYSYAQQNNEELIVIWIKTNECPGYFLDYFEQVDNIIFINDDNNNYKIDYIGHIGHKDYQPNYDKLYLKLEIKLIIKEKINVLNNNYIAVHIRRTDHIGYAKKINKYIDDYDFTNFINEHINDSNLYIATDNKETYDKFKNKYNNKVKFEYHETFNNLRHTTLKDSIIDLYMGVYANKFMGTTFSSFSNLITNLRLIRLKKDIKKIHEPIKKILRLKKS